MVNYNINWHLKVDSWSNSKLGQNLKVFLQAQEGRTIFPCSDHWFRAFELTSFDDVKVVILGQDPYRGDEQAHGLSFSVPDGINIPPSLRNIYTELRADLGVFCHSGNLEPWAKQGVLLLNSVLTVDKNSPKLHAGKGWEDFTNEVIKIINAEKQNVVFLLWGRKAQKKKPLINQSRHLILTAAHPSPFSAYKGFFGCKHFSQTNNYLKKHHLKTINWNLNP